MTSITKAFYHLQDGGEITGQMIADIIQENRNKYERMKLLYERYKGSKEGVPVLTRVPPIQTTCKVNNKLANDFFSDIIDTKTGYMAGRPVTYSYKPPEKGMDVSIITDTLQHFLKRNAIADLDSESIKMAAICGYCARYCYINPDGEVEVINVPPWECIFINDEMGVTDSDYAIRYYTVDIDKVKYTKAEFFTPDTVSYWIRDGDASYTNDSFIMDTSEEANPVSHFMATCPLLCFPNNEELLGDCEKILTLIDGYNNSISDMNSEIEQFRLAYLAFYGMVPDEETLDMARQTGAFGFPSGATGEQSRMEFITKNLNSAAVEAHLQKLEDNIYLFSKSVKITDQNFANASGVAMRYKMFALEAKCITTERKFIKSLYRQFMVLSGYFEKKGITIDPWNFEFVFVRNFPLDLMSEVQSLATMKGLVSDATAFSQMSFIEDAQVEIEKMADEQAEYTKYAAMMQPEVAPVEEAPIEGQPEVTAQEPQPTEEFVKE
jgi:SPP1 family phage portal protein